MRLTLSNFNHKKKDIKEKPAGDIPSFAQSPRGFILELVKIVLIALAIVLPVRFFLFQPYYVKGASMEPNFYDYQYLIVDEITYRFDEPARGDVVVVKVPFEQDALIKRVIALPGETVQIGHQQVEIFNQANPSGQVINESYLGQDITTSGNIRVTLGPDEYYILGDNRPVSLDSRVFGVITRHQIIGRAWLRVWPFKDFQHFTTPSYSF